MRVRYYAYHFISITFSTFSLSKSIITRCSLPGFIAIVFPIPSFPADSCMWPCKVINGCSFSINFLTALLPTCSPKLVISSSVLYGGACITRSEEHTSELQSQFHLVCRLLLEKKH